jgi:ankyrin repeat protein
LIPLRSYNRSAAALAWEEILSAPYNNPVCQHFMSLFPKEQALESMQFSSLIQTVIGLKYGGVYEEALAAGSNIDSQDDKGNTALNWAACTSQPDTIATLLQFEASINIPNIYGWTPLLCAINSLNPRSVRLLLEAGAKVDATDSVTGRSAMHVLAGASHEGEEQFCEILYLLLSRGMDIESKTTWDGTTPLSWAVSFNLKLNAATLITNGADINSFDRNGKSNVAKAVYWNSHECLRLLLSKGADCLRVDNEGYSLLHRTSGTGDVETIRILRQYVQLLTGLQVDQKNIDGQAPIDIAEKRDDVDPEWIAAWGELICAIMQNNEELEINAEAEKMEVTGKTHDIETIEEVEPLEDNDIFEDAIQFQ